MEHDAALGFAPGVSGARVTSVEPAGLADVYNLEVGETHAFAIAGGLIVHNCADETRYRVMHRKATIQQKKISGF